MSSLCSDEVRIKSALHRIVFLILSDLLLHSILLKKYQYPTALKRLATSTNSRFFILHLLCIVYHIFSISVFIYQFILLLLHKIYVKIFLLYKNIFELFLFDTMRLHEYT